MRGAGAARPRGTAWGWGRGRERLGTESQQHSRVFQVLDPQYGMYAWPCAVVLAQYVWFHRRTLPGRRVLEVMCSVMAIAASSSVLCHISALLAPAQR